MSQRGGNRGELVIPHREKAIDLETVVARSWLIVVFVAVALLQLIKNSKVWPLVDFCTYSYVVNFLAGKYLVESRDRK